MMNEYRITDPEFVERVEQFTFDEVVNDPEQQLDEETRWLAILSALIGAQSAEAFRKLLPQALDAGLSPVAVKETVYQAVDYLGLGRMLPFLDITNTVFSARSIALPLEGQATTTMDDRLEKGAQAQAEIFGEQMLEAWKAGTVNRWLAANCFGDYYTRGGLDLKARELITFCFLAAQGGCEPQLVAHSQGNMNLGNGKDFLLRVVLQILPYIGYPRSLNAITCVNKAADRSRGNAAQPIRADDCARARKSAERRAQPADGREKSQWQRERATETAGNNRR